MGFPFLEALHGVPSRRRGVFCGVFTSFLVPPESWGGTFQSRLMTPSCESPFFSPLFLPLFFVAVFSAGMPADVDLEGRKGLTSAVALLSGPSKARFPIWSPG
jgi:hypothetical protein